MLKPILRPILKSILQPVLSASTDLTRWVWALNGMSYGVVPVVERLSYTLEFAVKGTDIATGNKVVIGSSTSDTGFVRFRGGALDISSGASLYMFSGITVSNDAYTEYSIDYDYVSGDLTVNNITDNQQQTVNKGSLIHAPWSSIGAKGVARSENLGASLYYLRCNGITSPNYPSTTFNYTLNKEYSDPYFLPDIDNPDGAELVVNGDFSDGTNGWIPGGEASPPLTVDSNELTVTSVDGTYGRGYQDVPVVAGVSYLVSGSVECVQGDIAWFIIREAGVQYILAQASTGNTTEFTTVYTAKTNTATIELQTHNTGSPPIVKFKAVSIKQTTAMQTFNVLPADITEEAV